MATLTPRYAATSDVVHHSALRSTGTPQGYGENFLYIFKAGRERPARASRGIARLTPSATARDPGSGRNLRPDTTKSPASTDDGRTLGSQSNDAATAGRPDAGITEGAGGT
ncbi:hypothetical protein GCM10023170_050330 [Phytohabitans houttuyneae]